MKKLMLMALVLCIALTACGKKADKADKQDSAFSQSVSISYDLDKDFGDMLVKFLNSAAIKQKIGVKPSDVNSITAEREPDKEKPAENGRYNNVIRITIDTGDYKLSKQLFDTFYDKVRENLAELVKSNNVVIEKVE